MATPPTASRSAPPILDRAGDLLARYDLIFCDVWGVVHNGITAFEDACAALQKFRDKGGTVILVSNAPVPKARVAAMLDSRNVPQAAWDDIVSSGDIALAHVEERGFKKLYCIGPQDRDQALFKALKAEPVHLDKAEAIICTGLNDDRREKPEDYLPMLRKAHARDMPFVCANPDLLVDVGGTLLYCAGAIADFTLTDEVEAEIKRAALSRHQQFEFDGVRTVLRKLVLDVAAEMDRPLACGGEVEHILDREGGELGVVALIFPFGDERGAPPIGEGVRSFGFHLPFAVSVAAVEHAAAKLELGSALRDCGFVHLAGKPRLGGRGPNDEAAERGDENKSLHGHLFGVRANPSRRGELVPARNRDMRAQRPPR